MKNLNHCFQEASLVVMCSNHILQLPHLGILTTAMSSLSSREEEVTLHIIQDF